MEKSSIKRVSGAQECRGALACRPPIDIAEEVEQAGNVHDEVTGGDFRCQDELPLS
jgi:hypothetical protein